MKEKVIDLVVLALIWVIYLAAYFVVGALLHKSPNIDDLDLVLVLYKTVMGGGAFALFIYTVYLVGDALAEWIK